MPEGKRPFFMLDWLDQDDEKGSIGVAEMVRNAQEMVNWAVRAYEDNKKQTANAVWVLKRRLLVNDLKSIVPGQKIDVQDDCDDVRKAVMQLATQDVGEQLMNLIQLAEKYADKDSLIPALQQGQDVKEPQMRAFVAARQLEQAGKYIGQIISNIDTFSARFCTAIAWPAPTLSCPFSCSSAFSGTTKNPPPAPTSSSTP